MDVIGYYCVRGNADNLIKFMTFGNYCNSVPEKFHIRINGKQLKRVEKCKYLGIVFNYKLI